MDLWKWVLIAIAIIAALWLDPLAGLAGMLGAALFMHWHGVSI